MRLSQLRSYSRAVACAGCLALLGSACGGDQQAASQASTQARRTSGEEAKEMVTEKMKLTSTAFADGQAIPVRHSCEGEDLSPPLSWEGAPEGTRSFALICDDPDAPARTWDHWILFNIPGEKTGLPEGVPAAGVLPDGSLSGKNSWMRTGYGGPCPPPGKPHRYFFRIHALSTRLDLSAGVGKKELYEAMQGKVLASGALMGTYGR